MSLELPAADIRPSSAAEVLGPTVVGGVWEAILQGLLLSELSLFHRKPSNNQVIRLTVYWVNAVAM